jgi:hypothetical protein
LLPVKHNRVRGLPKAAASALQVRINKNFDLSSGACANIEFLADYAMAIDSYPLICLKFNPKLIP